MEFILLELYIFDATREGRRTQLISLYNVVVQIQLLEITLQFILLDNPN